MLTIGAPAQNMVAKMLHYRKQTACQKFVRKLSDFVEYAPQKVRELYWKYREEDVLKGVVAYAGMAFIFLPMNLFANPKAYVYVASVIFLCFYVWWLWRVCH